MPDTETDTTETDAEIKIQAAVYRKMVAHFRKYPEVQNIDLMNLAYFCRNCLSNWYQTAAAEHGVAMNQAQAREIVYGMPYADYKTKHSEEATAEQLQRFETAKHKASE